jgi:hypothetical protein
MKKIFTFLFTIVLAIVFTACGGGEKAKAPAEEPVKSEVVVEKVAAPEPVAPTLSPAEMLKNFQTYAKEYGEAFNGLPKTAAKFSQLAAQSPKKVSEMEQIKDRLNTRQLQDYQKALDIVAKVNRRGK